jgi:hypothetical protein
MSIRRMLGKLVSVITFTILIYSSLSSAGNVTIEKILDLSVFGNCNIYLKRFRDDLGTVDLTERIVVVQQKLRLDYALTTIDNATHKFPMANPTVSFFEGCILNIIVGIVPNDEGRLEDFMYDNIYTFTSTPFSTYILVPDSFNGKASEQFSLSTMVLLPVRVFYLLVPTVLHDDVNLYKLPYYLVCAHCSGLSWAKKMAVTSELAYICSLNFSSFWMRNDVQVVNRFYDGPDDITGCEHSPWSDFSERYGSSKHSICNSLLAFMDVLVRSVGSNLTVSAKYKINSEDNRFLGYLNHGYLSESDLDLASSAWFYHISIGLIHFCDCKPQSQRQILNAWITPFKGSVWLCLMIIFLLLSLTIVAKLEIGKGQTKKIGMKDFGVPIITVAGIYLRQQGSKFKSDCLMLLSSLCIGLILSLYENCVTSALIVPTTRLEHNLSSLLMAAGAKVIYIGPKLSLKSSEVSELLAETKKWNIKYSKDQFQLNNKLHHKGIPVENGTRLSYFAFYSAAEGDVYLRQLKLLNNKCHCYIVKHAFRQREIYIILKLFLRNRFVSVANILRESGISYFFNEIYRKHGHNIALAKLRRWLEENESPSDFFVREEPRVVQIELENLYFIFVILGGTGFLAVIIFTLRQMVSWDLFVYFKSILCTQLHAIRRLNYVKLANRLCAIMLERMRALKS